MVFVIYVVRKCYEKVGYAHSLSFLNDTFSKTVPVSDL